MGETLSLAEIHALATRVLAAAGIASDATAAIADTVTAAEADGAHAHGLFRLPGYVSSVRSGRADPMAVPMLEDIAPGVARVDAARGFAPLALRAGRPPLADKARANGIAALAVRNSHNFNALWYDLEPLAAQGLVVFAFVNSRSYMAPWGGKEPLFGTNPMAFAWPREGQPPMIFDQASSAIARGEVQIAARDGKPIAEGWAIDAEGNPTTDAEQGLAGSLLPFGGYKGAAIALMVELLAGGLSGANFGFEALADYEHVPGGDGGPSNAGELLIAIDPARFAPDGAPSVLTRAEAVFARLLAQEGARLPADRRYANRARTARDGVRVPAVLLEELRLLGG